MNKLRVVLSLMTRDSDYQLEQAKAAEAVAQQQNVDLEIFYADGNSVTQSTQLLNLIHKYKTELSAILVAPAGGTEFPQVGRAAVSAGIAWVVLNRGASSLVDLRRDFQAPAFAISSDHKQVGRIQAQQLAAILPPAATVLCIQGPSNSLAAQHRLIGLERAKPTRMTLKILKSSNWTEEGGFQAASSWLRLTTSQQQPICAVAAQKDLIAMGARKAFEEAKASYTRRYIIAAAFPRSRWVAPHRPSVCQPRLTDRDRSGPACRWHSVGSRPEGHRDQDQTTRTATNP